MLVGDAVSVSFRISPMGIAMLVATAVIVVALLFWFILKEKR
jgi:hypothetical protein